MLFKVAVLFPFLMSLPIFEFEYRCLIQNFMLWNSRIYSIGQSAASLKMAVIGVVLTRPRQCLRAALCIVCRLFNLLLFGV